MKINTWYIKIEQNIDSVTQAYFYIHSIQDNKIIYDYINCYEDGRIEYIQFFPFLYDEFIKFPKYEISFSEIPKEIIAAALTPVQIAKFRIENKDVI